MKVFRSLPILSPTERDKPVALALGSFDGMHLGHQAMLRRVCEAASDLDFVPSVLTFEPTPREYFMKERAPAKLLQLRERLQRIAETGIERIYLLRFDERLALMPADCFTDVFLTEMMLVRWLLISGEANFGKGRVGNLAFLRGRDNAFLIEEMETIQYAGMRISSTAVREALLKNDLETAQILLGRPYSISGRVRRGDQRGRKIGFPTLNLPLSLKPAISGVFAVRVRGLGKTRYGIASLGVRPTVKQNASPILEAHLFDFDENAYGHNIEVEFVARIRDEARFADVNALVKQIEEDARWARRYFQETDNDCK
ncbi:MAG: bifunctional riboflavin kinase/FAD synthetase [Burkholderiales bacterium]|nr:bifunctional riboflavin kinase/FAD synthetase [Burkholderiales bacterium]